MPGVEFETRAFKYVVNGLSGNAHLQTNAMSPKSQSSSPELMVVAAVAHTPAGEAKTLILGRCIAKRWCYLGYRLLGTMGFNAIITECLPTFGMVELGAGCCSMVEPGGASGRTCELRLQPSSPQKLSLIEGALTIAHITKRSCKTLVFGIPSYWAFWNQNVRSLCLRIRTPYIPSSFHLNNKRLLPPVLYNLPGFVVIRVLFLVSVKKRMFLQNSVRSFSEGPRLRQPHIALRVFGRLLFNKYNTR